MERLTQADRITTIVKTTPKEVVKTVVIEKPVIQERTATEKVNTAETVDQHTVIQKPALPKYAVTVGCSTSLDFKCRPSVSASTRLFGTRFFLDVGSTVSKTPLLTFGIRMEFE